MIESLDIASQINEKILAALSGLIIGLFILGVAWRNDYFKMNSSLDLPMISIKDLLYSFGYFILAEVIVLPLLIVLFVLLVYGMSFDLSTDLTKGWITQGIVLGGFFSVGIALLRIPKEIRRQIWNQTFSPIYHSIGIGYLTMLLSFPLLVAVNQGLSLVVWKIFHVYSIDQVVVQSLKKMEGNSWLYLTTALSIITVIPITEEILFRGFLQSWLKRRFQSHWIGIIIASLIFAFFHFSFAQGLTNIELLGSLFFLSCAIGISYEKQQSLWTPIAFHSIFNLTSLVLIYFQE